jgi:predicted nucleic acid-binding protein
MRRFLIDTTSLSGLLSNRPEIVSLVTPWMRAHEAATSILVYGEVLEGLKGRSNFSRRHADLLTLLGEITPYFVTHAIMQHYADLRRQLRPPHGSGLIGDIDTLIAATTLEYDLTLVTTDGDFGRVPGLKYLRLDRLTLKPLSGQAHS